jgi:hypothetical protein
MVIFDLEESINSDGRPTAMNPIHIETTIESDGILHIDNLPCHKGDRVEATIVLPQQKESSSQDAARQRFLTRARQSSFRSSMPYPSRDELHDRN